MSSKPFIFIQKCVRLDTAYFTQNFFVCFLILFVYFSQVSLETTFFKIKAGFAAHLLLKEGFNIVSQESAENVENKVSASHLCSQVSGQFCVFTIEDAFLSLYRKK